MNRLFITALATAALSALAISAWTYNAVMRDRQSAALNATEVLAAISERANQHALLQSELKQEPFAEPGTGVLGAYLTKVRRDGLPAHSEMRQKINELSKLNIALLTLIELYEPQARTPNFKKEVRAFRSYALVWLDRWGSVMEYFMAGGNPPASDAPFPDGFRAAVEAEKKVVAN